MPTLPLAPAAMANVTSTVVSTAAVCDVHVTGTVTRAAVCVPATVTDATLNQASAATVVTRLQHRQVINCNDP